MQFDELSSDVPIRGGDNMVEICFSPLCSSSSFLLSFRKHFKLAQLLLSMSMSGFSHSLDSTIAFRRAIRTRENSYERELFGDFEDPRMRA